MNKEDLIDITLGDPTPSDSAERKAYVAKVAGFFKDVMEPKINHMISVAHNMMEATDSDREFDLILKGVVYSFREFKKWGEMMLNEQIANQIDVPEDENIKTLKDSLK